MDCSPPGSSVHEIFQARLLEWVAIPFSRGSPRPKYQTHESCVPSIGRQVLYHWATREAAFKSSPSQTHTTDHLFPPPGIKCPPFPLRTPLSKHFLLWGHLSPGTCLHWLGCRGPSLPGPSQTPDAQQASVDLNQTDERQDLRDFPNPNTPRFLKALPRASLVAQG